MKLNIYQINLDRDENGVAFEPLDALPRWQNSAAIDSALYDRVYGGDVSAEDIEDVYRIFNIDKPDDFNGRSLSVSDVVEITESEEVKPGFYYCDNIGFKSVEFEPEKCGEVKKDTITVVMCEPGKKAYTAEIGTELEALQAAVGGCIEVYYPFESEECVVCNDEGKINGMSPSRGIYGEDGELMDIIFGKFFICDCSGENFGSLSPEKQQEYLEKYRQPERFFRVNGDIKAVKYEPRETAAER